MITAVAGSVSSKLSFMHYVGYFATLQTVGRIPGPSSYGVHLSFVPVHPVVRSSIMSAVLSVSSLIEV